MTFLTIMELLYLIVVGRSKKIQISEVAGSTSRGGLENKKEPHPLVEWKDQTRRP